MQFVGFDPAWPQNGGTGLCLAKDGHVLASTRLASGADVIAWLTPHAQDDVVFAIDASVTFEIHAGGAYRRARSPSL
jgi:predicted RNase H-like nuclease